MASEFTPAPATGSSTFPDDFVVKVTCWPVQPVCVGVKETLTETLSPAGTTAGSLRPLRLNSDPLMLVEEMVMLLVPGLVMTASCVSIWPTATWPKRNCAGEKVKVCVAA